MGEERGLLQREESLGSAQSRTECPPMTADLTLGNPVRTWRVGDQFEEVTLEANVRSSRFLLNLAYELKVVVPGVSGPWVGHFVYLVVQCKYSLQSCLR